MEKRIREHYTCTHSFSRSQIKDEMLPSWGLSSVASEVGLSRHWAIQASIENFESMKRERNEVVDLKAGDKEDLELVELELRVSEQVWWRFARRSSKDGGSNSAERAKMKAHLH